MLAGLSHTAEQDLTVLRSRIRLVIFTILLSGVVFEVTDLAIGRDSSITSALVGIQTAVAVLGLLLLRRSVESRRVTTIGVLVAVTAFACSATSGVFTGDNSGTRILCTMLALTSAAVVPWSVRAQSLVAAAAAAAILGNSWSHGQAWPLPYPTAAAMVGLLGSVAISLEMTRSRRYVAEVEAQRRASEEERDRFFDLSIDMLCVADVGGHLRRANRAMTDRLGYSAAQLASAPVVEFVHPEDREATAEKFGRLAKGEDVVGFTHRLRRSDGTYCWVEWAAHAASDKTIFAVGRDITERREALQGSVDALSANIAILDRNGDIIAVNAAWRRFANANNLGDPLCGVGQNYFDICAKAAPADPDAGRLLEDLHRLLRGEAELILSDYICNSPTERRWFELRVTRFEIDGKIKLAVAHVDISQRKLVEEELAAARDRALGASEQKSRFLATMSHEVRTPLGAIIGLIDILRDTDLDPDQQSIAVTVQNSGVAMLAIVNDLLDLARIEAGKVALEVSEFSVHKLLEDLVQLFAADTRRKGISLKFEVADDVPANVRGDRGRLRQILTNLIGNAVKFTAKGGIVVRVSRSLCVENRLVLRCEVADTGRGISERDQASLFESFARAKSSGDSEGTGLGLAICRELTALMDGSIDIVSRLGEGTTVAFTVTLGSVAAESESSPLAASAS